MTKLSSRLLAVAVLGAIATSLFTIGLNTNPVQASSHREAPLIIADPLADNTDVYAFRSYEPGREGFVTLIANFIPFQEPSGGPHFYLFDPTVLYEIKIDNTGDGVEDITYQFTFTTNFVNGDAVLGMAFPNEAAAGTGGIEPLITSLEDPDYNEYQTYTVRRVTGKTNGQLGRTILARDLRMPPSNIGERTTPNYEAVLGQPAVYTLSSGGRVFTGQRDDGFYIDLGAAFDTLALRGGGVSPTGGVDGLSGFNVNTLALEVPIQALTRNNAVPASTTDPNAVIGVWATASRQTTRVIRPGFSSSATAPEKVLNNHPVNRNAQVRSTAKSKGKDNSAKRSDDVDTKDDLETTVDTEADKTRVQLIVPSSPANITVAPATQVDKAPAKSTGQVNSNAITLNAGPYRQVSRLGNPLVNELIIPLRLKDTFNSSEPVSDAQFAQFVLDPQLARLIAAVFGITVPGPITPATAFTAPPANRTDLVTIFATGIPAGAVPGAPTFTNFLSDGQPHEYQRLNVAIPPTPAGMRSRLGLLGNDPGGFPNGRRVFDDVVDIELRAVAGGTPFTPAFNVSPNNQLSDGVSNNDVPYLERFPYLGVPQSGNTKTGKPHEHHVICCSTPGLPALP